MFNNAGVFGPAASVDEISLADWDATMAVNLRRGRGPDHESGFGITCGQIDIGNTATELIDQIGVGSGALQADGTRKAEPPFPVKDATRAVLLMAGMPASASVGSLVVTAAGMPFSSGGGGVAHHLG